MNKIITIIIVLLTTISCTEQEDILVGTWKFDGPFHKATYEITAEGSGFIGKVIDYDDGTSHYTSKDALLCFEGLKKQDSIYVDGISGASASNKTAKTICIKVKNQDSLKATTYVMGRAIKEWWVRQK